MKICIAQTNPIKGEIQKNIENHIKFINLAISRNTDLIVFPELSLSGYEPELAKDLATTQDDTRLDVFQKISDTKNITIGVGLPTKGYDGLHISMIIFRPQKERLTYSKQFLYPTEVDYFVPGGKYIFLKLTDSEIVAPVICYELSNPEHSETAYKNNANIYIASVLNSVSGVDNDLVKLSAIAQKYKMTTFMANFIGESGGYKCAGKSSVWNSDGELVGQLDEVSEGVLIYDTKIKQIVKEVF